VSEHSNDSHGAIVIGAGPAGVAVAATLGAKGVETVVLERGDAVGTSWREHYDGLRLNSMRIYSKLPGLPIPRRYGRFVSRDDFLAYLEAYEALNRLDVRYGCEAIGSIATRRVRGVSPPQRASCTPAWWSSRRDLTRARRCRSGRRCDGIVRSLR
jgi:2-polyprenyl-6-methoxyphenol hydroxylase-like FAD-dependent oxidoreductase